MVGGTEELASLISSGCGKAMRGSHISCLHQSRAVLVFCLMTNNMTDRGQASLTPLYRFKCSLP